MDHEVHLSPNLGREPDANGSINGLSAVEFTAVDQTSKKLWGYRKGANWNPMGENGAPSGKLTDGSLYMIYPADKNAKSNFPFNFGWSSHFPWENDQIYIGGFQIEEENTFLANHGDELMVGFEVSVTQGIRCFIETVRAYTGQEPAPTNIGGPFFFPHRIMEDPIPEWTVGEIVVVRGVVQRDDHQRIEGYLAHKWGLADQLPTTHAYAPSLTLLLEMRMISSVLMRTEPFVPRHPWTMNMTKL